jgi:hypothetical protein
VAQSLRRAERNLLTKIEKEIKMFKSLTRVTFPVLMAVAAICTGSAFAQSGSSGNDLQSTLSSLSESAATGYVSPIVSGFGADLNSGWVHSAPKATKFSFDLEFGIVGMGSFFSSGSKSFNTSAPYNFGYNDADNMIPNAITGARRDSIRTSIMNLPLTVAISGPTIVGSKGDTVKVTFSGGTVSFTAPNGARDSVNIPSYIASTGVTGYLENLPALPMGAPQLSIGTVFGTSLSFRYLPSIELDKKIGKLSYFGFGFQHNPMVWFPNSIPVDISLAFFTQTLKVGDIFKSTATDFGIFASKRFGPGALNVTPYLGLSVESSKMTVTYNYDTSGPNGQIITVPISFDMKGENSTRLTVGLAIKLVFLNISADYTLAKYNVASVGVGIII